MSANGMEDFLHPVGGFSPPSWRIFSNQLEDFLHPVGVFALKGGRMSANGLERLLSFDTTFAKHLSALSGLRAQTSSSSNLSSQRYFFVSRAKVPLSSRSERRFGIAIKALRLSAMFHIRSSPTTLPKNTAMTYKTR